MIVTACAQARVKMYRQMQEDIERKRQLVDEDSKRRQEELSRQQEATER